MSILTVLIVIIVVGVLLWLCNTYIPMSAPVKSLLNIVAVIFLVLYLLQAFGILSYLGNARIH